ncbi:MAG: NUDIX hydrolase [Xanthomonadales bacterium]|nr:NUDIX hydrolase [Xanthomonadales bacterium]
MDTTPPTEDALLHEGNYLRLKRRGRWEFAERTNASSAVIIVAVTPEDRVLFVEQYRVPVSAASIEMPAGLVGDLGHEEAVETAAQRELLEETGWQAGRIEYLMAGPSSSGMSNEMIAFVRAHDLVQVSAGGGDETESITVHEVPRQEVATWLHDKLLAGFSIDPKLYAGLYFLDRNPDGSPSR